ncbi:MAG TPA: hypothetical protein VIC54_13525 [Terriglobales bacterium]
MTTICIVGIVIAGCVALHHRFDRRYRGHVTAAQHPTSEIFRDPATGALTRVYEDPRSGARSYKPE